MRAAQIILFPWLGKFKQLGLPNRWWHRLAVVVFFVALVPAFGVFWAVGYAALQPVHSYMPDISNWVRGAKGIPEQVTLGDRTYIDDGLPNKYSGPPILLSPAVGSSLNEQIAMPDGTPGEFYGTSNEEIKAAWNKALDRAVRKQWCLGLLIGIALTMVFSYLLQTFYRALLYIVYGSKVDEGLTHNDDQSWVKAVDVVQAHTGLGKRHTWVR